MSARTRTLAILFADIGGSTALYEAVGDAEAHRRVAESLALMREAIEANHGTLLRTVGDAALASFERVDDACRAAFEIQRRHARGPLSVRVGFHLGPVIPDRGDVYGGAVNVAARVAAFARTDEIVATEAAIAALSAEHRARATLLERREMRGLARPLEIHRLRWQERDVTITHVADAAAAHAALAGRLVLERGTLTLTLEGEGGALDIGRAEDNDLVVDDACASRRHARLEARRGQFRLLDQSTNGTWLLREGRAPLHLRRDAIALDGSGYLGLGALPGRGAQPLAFRVEWG